MSLYSQWTGIAEMERTPEENNTFWKEYFDIEQITKSHIDQNKKILTLGGDHSITFPIIKAHFNNYPTLDILQIDAHCDLYDEFEGDKYGNFQM